MSKLDCFFQDTHPRLYSENTRETFLLWWGQPSSLLFTSIYSCQPPPLSGAGATVFEQSRASPVSYKHTQIIYMLYSSKAALLRPVEICRRSEPPILHLGVLRLTFATAKNVMNFLNTAVDLLLRGRGATRDTCLPSSV